MQSEKNKTLASEIQESLQRCPSVNRELLREQSNQARNAQHHRQRAKADGGDRQTPALTRRRGPAKGPQCGGAGQDSGHAERQSEH